jgi:hypothetical protein
MAVKQIIFAAFFLVAVVAHAQQRDLTERIAFVRLTTMQESDPGAGSQRLVRDVLLRLTQMGTSNAFLALSGQPGTVVVPVEAGTWCVQPYSIDGRPVKLSLHTMQSSHRCFTAVPGTMTEFGVTLALNTTLSGRIPGLGGN